MFYITKLEIFPYVDKTFYPLDSCFYTNLIIRKEPT